MTPTQAWWNQCYFIVIYHSISSSYSDFLLLNMTNFLNELKETMKGRKEILKWHTDAL